MKRLAAFFVCFMLVLSLGLGSVAHATEGVSCANCGSPASYEHTDGDSDPVPGDADKAYPHHHGECHGHHIGVPLSPNPVFPMIAHKSTPLAWSDSPRSLAPSEAALRPPQA